MKYYFLGSPVKTTDIDFDLYTERKLSETFRIFWRILKETSELEVVMVVNSTSYVGLGWRPLSLTNTCKNFPIIGPTATTSDENATAEPNTVPEPKGEPQGEPEPTSEPKSEPEPTSKPEPVSEPEPKTEPEPKSEPEPNSTPEPVSKAEPTATPEPEAEPTTTIKSKYKKSLYSRRSASHSPTVLKDHNNGDVVETSVSFKVSAKQGTYYYILYF